MRFRLALLVVMPLASLLCLPAEGRANDQPACPSPTTATSSTADGQVSPYRGQACTLSTGFLTSETHLRVAPDGTIVQQPAESVPGIAGTGFVKGAPGPKPQSQVTPAGFAISQDSGRSFHLVFPSGAQWVASDGALHIDGATGRLYYYALSPVAVPADGTVPLTDQVPAGYAHLMTSDDNGRTWFHTQAPGYFESENPRFVSGPTPVGGDLPIPGERVAYWCGNTMLFAYGQRDCWRTLDGGHTWAARATLLRRGIPIHPECGNNEEQFAASDGNYPQSAPDGGLWSLVSCGGKTFLAHSTDEMLTFPVVRSIPAIQELRVDADGVMYGVSKTGGSLVLRTSSDAGRTWTSPLELVAPARRGAAIGQWAMALRGPGQVAVSYLSAHPGSGWDGSVTLVRGANLVSATVHDGLKALVTSPSAAQDDYIDLDVAPDGSAWASFYGDCGAEAPCGTSSPNPRAKISVLLHVS